DVQASAASNDIGRDRGCSVGWWGTRQDQPRATLGARPMLERVTIEQLRPLRAVADAGSFSAAARKLGRVQAAVSQSIDRLEAQLGLRLFDRSGRVPRLTRNGEAILA